MIGERGNAFFYLGRGCSLTRVMTELKDQLSLLGRKTEYKQDYAPEVLEAFDNKHLEND